MLSIVNLNKLAPVDFFLQSNDHFSGGKSFHLMSSARQKLILSSLLPHPPLPEDGSSNFQIVKAKITCPAYIRCNFLYLLITF